MKTMKIWRKTLFSKSRASIIANGRARTIQAIAFAMFTVLTIASCSSKDNEEEKPLTTDPVKQTMFFVCEPNSETRDATAAIDTIFTENDIEWFNVTTREIRFKVMDEQLFKKLVMNYHKEHFEFRLGENILFEVSRFVSDFDSRIFTDLVLHYSFAGNDESDSRYYLRDCYPSQFINDEHTQANIKKNAKQWEAFIKYLESKGKIKR